MQAAPFFSPAGPCRVSLDRPRSSGRTRFGPSCFAVLVQFSSSETSEYLHKCAAAKNLDVMGFEPMTPGLEPASLTTRSNGSLFENGRGSALSTPRIFMGGDATENDDFSKKEIAFAGVQKIFSAVLCWGRCD